MKKILIFFLVFASLLITPKTLASEKSSNELFQDFQNNYRRYQETIEPYNTSKSREQTYQSLDSQLELLESSKKLLSAEIEAIISYARYIRSYLTEATKILQYQENFIFVMLDDEIAFFDSAREKVRTLSTLSEVQPLADSFAKHYQKISQYSYQIKAITETKSANKITENLIVENGKIENIFSQLGTESAKTKLAKEKLFEINNIIDQTKEILSQAETKQKIISQDNFPDVGKQIRNLIVQAIEKQDVILSGFRNIIVNLQ